MSVTDLADQYDNVTSGIGDDRPRRCAWGCRISTSMCPRAMPMRMRAKLVEAGAVTASEETAETLRIEAGRPRFGVDMNTDTIPLEAGIEDRAISFTKGCYVGQEVIIRVMHRGHGRVARRLVSIVAPGRTGACARRQDPRRAIASSERSPAPQHRPRPARRWRWATCSATTRQPVPS